MNVTITDQTWFIVAIIIYMLLMLAIGYWSYRQTDRYDEYMLAGRSLGPVVAALSAGAADMSGWLLMGLPGALFVTGLSEIWIAVGLCIGAAINWIMVAPRLRAYTEVAGNSITIPSFLENRLHDSSHILRIVASLVILVFFTFYVSSGMVSGGKYFESTFGGSYIDGMLIIAFVTVAYTFIGGFLAVSYTDAVQGMIMFGALVIVPISAYIMIGGDYDIFSYATSNAYGPHPDGNPTYFSLFTGVSAAAIIGNLAWGLGYFGQPHIIVRFMALRSPKEARSGMFVTVFWMVICALGAAGTALVGTVFFGAYLERSVTDQTSYETIFLDMGRLLFHPLIGGLILTAVLAAIMSTMASQLLVVSSALIEDLYKITTKRTLSDGLLMNLSRTAVVAVAIIAALLAINPSDSILSLVGFAWAGFGSAFGPVILASLFWKRLTAPGAIAGMITGTIVVFAWGNSALGDWLYEIVPGFLGAGLVLVIVSLLTATPTARTLDEFEKAQELAVTGGYEK